MTDQLATAAAEAGSWRGFAGQLRRSLRDHIGPLTIVLLFAAVGGVTGSLYGVSVLKAIWLYVPTYFNIVPLSITVLLAAHGARIVFVIRPKRPLSMMVRDIRERFVTAERIALALPVLLFMPVFAGTFTLFKSLLSRINEFSWDATFAAWDAALHFGHAPWELLQPILGTPMVTWTVNWFYNAWFFVLALVWIWQAFAMGDRHLRLQFFYTLLLTWIVLGVGGAIVFASAGPCYYGLVVEGPDPFGPLMAYLHAADQKTGVWALRAQETLWRVLHADELRLGGGISAMPSMHVAMAFLFYLTARRASRPLGWILFAYFVVVLVGSVHLGWHYAIDGYAVVLAVLPIWFLAGRLAARTHPRPAPLPATNDGTV